ncbi:MAG: YgfZ/GcvT domain-containing protein [Sphingorhabdus sp.]
MSAPRLYDRAVIRLSPTETGEDVRGFLQGLVTQDTNAGMPLWAGLLTPQGKTLFDFFLWNDPSAPGQAQGSGQRDILADILIDCEAGQAEALARRLSLYRLRRKISIMIDPTLGVFWAMAAPQGFADPRLTELGVRWIASAGSDDSDVSALYRAHRLSLGVTEGISELGSDATLWLETNAAELNGVSFTKGCYVGQENTARMNWRQKVNRRLAVVAMDAADPKRLRIAYPELGLAVVHARVEDLDPARLPQWQAAALVA